MQWLVRLVTPPGGIALDPFAGTGSTGSAADLEERHASLIEKEGQSTSPISNGGSRPGDISFEPA